MGRILRRIRGEESVWFGDLRTAFWTQNTLEGLYISSGLGKPWDPLGGAGKCCWGKGRLEYLACCHHDPATEKQKKMDEWIIYLSITLCICPSHYVYPLYFFINHVVHPSCYIVIHHIISLSIIFVYPSPYVFICSHVYCLSVALCLFVLFIVIIHHVMFSLHIYCLSITSYVYPSSYIIIC